MKSRKAESKTFDNVVAIVGPTAVGKTAAAVELVYELGGEIVSADSMAVYRGMDIGTAKPTSEELRGAAIHLIDVADPAQPFSVGEYASLAQNALDDVLKRNPPAVLVGGSGLYVRAAIDGLAPSVPAADGSLRRELEEEARVHGKEYVHSRLAKVDPESASRIHPNNLKRVIRALEIYEATGEAPSTLFGEDSKRAPRYPGTRFFGLTMDREALYERVDRRVDAMMEAGLVDEVAGLIERGVDTEFPSMQGLGYKEISEFLKGRCSKEEAVALIKRSTRQFAKRQYTWFRADKRIVWMDVQDRTARDVSRLIKESLSDE